MKLVVRKKYVPYIYQRSRETRLITEHLLVSYRRFQEQYFYHSLIRDSDNVMNSMVHQIADLHIGVSK